MSVRNESSELLDCLQRGMQNSASLGSFGAGGVWFVREHLQLFRSINVLTDITTAATTVGSESFLAVNESGMQYCMNKMLKKNKNFLPPNNVVF